MCTDLSPVGSNYTKAEIVLDVKYTHTDTHTHIYIYIYSYFNERVISTNLRTLSFAI